jgi:2-aminoadipate transaminase
MRETLSSLQREEEMDRMPTPDPDRFNSLYAGRIKGMKSAATRDLMSTLSQPGMISLAGGFPDTKTFGEEAFQEICGAVAADSAQALQYGPTAGLESIRDVIVDVMAAEGTPARKENILVTAGAQQGLDLIAKVFLDEGDAVLCEGPTYVGALNAFSSYQPHIIHVPMDEAGIIPAAVREALDEADQRGTRVKFIYTIPNFHNPAGVTLAAERRRELLEIAQEHDLIILEDNPYGMLRFEGEAPPTLAALEQESGDTDRVVYLGTFSKIFAPGARLGWIHARPDILQKVNLVKQGADLCSSNLSQMLVSAYFQNSDWRGYVARLIEVYRERRDAMLEALAEFMPRGVHWTRPEGGLFVWVTLPSYIDATTMLSQAIAHNVAYVSGESFYADGEGKNQMRLNFSFAESEKIRRAIELLAEVVREQMETSIPEKAQAREVCLPCTQGLRLAPRRRVRVDDGGRTGETVTSIEAYANRRRYSRRETNKP